MGARQSGPAPSAAAPDGRPRAYSGGEAPRGREAAHAGPGGSASAAAPAPPAPAPRSRSLAGPGAPGARAARSAFSLPSSSAGLYGSQDSVSSTPEDGGGGRERPGPGGGHGGGGGGGGGGPRLVIGSLPAHLSPHLFGGFKCPVCSKFVSSDEMDLHLVMCLTKPRITYNEFCESELMGRTVILSLCSTVIVLYQRQVYTCGPFVFFCYHCGFKNKKKYSEDVLSKEAGECAICLEDLQQGDTIARLPCLCIYHKGCIDEWFEVNRSCPEHPSD